MTVPLQSVPAWWVAGGMAHVLLSECTCGQCLDRYRALCGVFGQNGRKAETAIGAWPICAACLALISDPHLMIKEGSMRESPTVPELVDLLNQVGCPMDAEDASTLTCDQIDEAHAWAEAVLFQQEVFPPRPDCLSGWDVPRCRRCGCTQGRACPAGCSWIEPNLCSACVGPKSLIELVAFLDRRPHVEILGPRGERDIARFQRAGDGGLWFQGEHKNHYVPVRCGIGRADQSETGLRFEADQVVVTKFDVPVVIRYLPGASPTEG